MPHNDLNPRACESSTIRCGRDPAILSRANLLLSAATGLISEIKTQPLLAIADQQALATLTLYSHQIRGILFYISYHVRRDEIADKLKELQKSASEFFKEDRHTHWDQLSRVKLSKVREKITSNINNFRTIFLEQGCYPLELFGIGLLSEIAILVKDLESADPLKAHEFTQSLLMLLGSTENEFNELMHLITSFEKDPIKKYISALTQIRDRINAPAQVYINAKALVTAYLAKEGIKPTILETPWNYRLLKQLVPLVSDDKNFNPAKALAADKKIAPSSANANPVAPQQKDKEKVEMKKALEYIKRHRNFLHPANMIEVLHPPKAPATTPRLKLPPSSLNPQVSETTGPRAPKKSRFG